MTCIIIDDDLFSRTVLKRFCREVGDLEVLAEFEHPNRAVTFLNRKPVDLVFLDVMMPDLNGFDVLDAINAQPHVILTTTHPQFALKSYDYENVVDYLLKPVTPVRFSKAIRTARKRILAEPPEARAEESQSANSLCFNIDKNLIQIPTTEILFVEAQRDYITIQCLTRKFRVHTTLKAVRDRLTPSHFMQIHRSFLVNLEHITDVKGGSLMAKDFILPISRANRIDLKTRLLRS